MMLPMATKKVRGVFEKIPDSGVWWIQYFENGKRRRERVGSKSNAKTLYNKRKTQIFAGEKLPEMHRKRVLFGDLIDDALQFARDHDRLMRNYERKAEHIRAEFGATAAEDITATSISTWIRKGGPGAARFNRYRSFFSLCFREGMRNGKASTNPARSVHQRRESTGRKRFMTREEYGVVLEQIRIKFPHKPLRAPAFIISIHTGMRLNEQYGLRWRDVDFDRNEINVRDTKNHEDRTIPMASVVLEQFEALRPEKYKLSDLVLPRAKGGSKTYVLHWFTPFLADLTADKDIPAEIDGYTWHSNRHTFCSWLAIGGASLKTIQELAGHKDIKMSARYSHLSPDHKKMEIEKLVQAPGPKVVQMPRREAV